MAKDIAPELIDKVQKAFTKKYQASPKIKGALEVINKGEATYKNASAFAEEVGDLLAKTFQEEIGKENLPDGRMYYNIADRLLNNTLGKNYDLISSYTKDTQKVLNEKAGIGVKPAVPEINQSRIDHLVERIAEEEDYDKIKWMLDEPVTNFSMAVVDDFVKANIKLHYDMGLHPKIVRKEHGHSCSYCHPLAGEFQYPDEVPDDVYRRHPYCRCTVEYFPGDGKRQNVWTKREYDARDERVLKAERQKDLFYLNRKEDRKQYFKIIETLGEKEAPISLNMFQELKYNKHEEYERLLREQRTISRINSKAWSDEFKQRVKDTYYGFRKEGHEFTVHGCERFIKHEARGKYSKEEVLAVLSKDFNYKQASDGRPVKYYNDIQAVYLDDGVEVLNIIKRKTGWRSKGRLNEYSE